MPALNCSIEVTAGVIPGQPMPEHHRVWHFTEEDLNEKHKFIDGSGSALNYAANLQNPNFVNWVRLDWVWY